MTPLQTAQLIVLATLTTGCASPSYWYETPAPEQLNLITPDGSWQGLARNAYSYRTTYGAIAGPVEISCARYQDLISLQVLNGQLEGTLGTAPRVSFTTALNASGEFSHQMPVRGDTWIYGGVGIYNNDPQLKVWGKLDSVRGIGTGQISVTPRNETLGCYGHFQVSHNSGAPPSASLGAPFKIKYWINRSEGGNRDRRILPTR